MDLSKFNHSRNNHLDIRAGHLGQYTSLIVYDPQNRGSAFVESVLTAAGLRPDVQDEGEPVPNARPIDPPTSAGDQLGV